MNTPSAAVRTASKNANLLRADSMLYFFFAAMFSGGFISSMFIHKGYDAAQIGIITSLATCSAFLGNFFGGYIVDRVGSNKKPYIVSLTLILIILLSMNITDSFTAVLVLMMLLSFLNAPLAITLDVWTLKLTHNTKTSFASVRLFGSGGWAVSGLIMGQLINNYGWRILPFIAIPLYTLILGVILATPDVPSSSLTGRKLQLNRVAIRSLFSNRVYMLVILTAFLTNLYKFITFSFAPVILQNVGGSDKHLGYFIFFRAIVEIPMYLIYPHLLKRFSAMSLFTFSILIIPFEAVGMYFASTPWAVVSVCTISGLSFGIFLPTIRQMIFSMAPDDLKTTAQTVAESLFVSLSAATSSIAAGFMFTNIGFDNTFLSGFAVSVLSCVFCIFLLYPAAKKSMPELTKVE